jgi:hypothetical protein
VSWLKKHWKGLLTGVCGVASVGAAVIPGAAPVGIAVGIACTALTAAHVLEAKDVDHAKDVAAQLGAGLEGVKAELEQLEAKGKGKAK